MTDSHASTALPPGISHDTSPLAHSPVQSDAMRRNQRDTCDDTCEHSLKQPGFPNAMDSRHHSVSTIPPGSPPMLRRTVGPERSPQAVMSPLSEASSMSLDVSCSGTARDTQTLHECCLLTTEGTNEFFVDRDDEEEETRTDGDIEDGADDRSVLSPTGETINVTVNNLLAPQQRRLNQNRQGQYWDPITAPSPETGVATAVAAAEATPGAAASSDWAPSEQPVAPHANPTSGTSETPEVTSAAIPRAVTLLTPISCDDVTRRSSAVTSGLQSPMKMVSSASLPPDPTMATAAPTAFPSRDASLVTSPSKTTAQSLTAPASSFPPSPPLPLPASSSVGRSTSSQAQSLHRLLTGLGSTSDNSNTNTPGPLPVQGTWLIPTDVQGGGGSLAASSRTLDMGCILPWVDSKEDMNNVVASVSTGTGEEDISVRSAQGDSSPRSTTPLPCMTVPQNQALLRSYAEAYVDPFEKKEQLFSNTGGYMNLSPGNVLHNRYILVRKLGMGAYSTVWMAYDTQFTHCYRQDRRFQRQISKDDTTTTPVPVAAAAAPTAAATLTKEKDDASMYSSHMTSASSHASSPLVEDMAPPALPFVAVKVNKSNPVIASSARYEIGFYHYLQSKVPCSAPLARMLQYFEAPSGNAVHLCMVMPLYGPNLMCVCDAFRRKGRRERRTAEDMAMIKQVLRDVLQGLEALEQAHILHTDIKPENVLCAMPDPRMLADMEAFCEANQGNKDSAHHDDVLTVAEVRAVYHAAYRCSSQHLVVLSDFGLSIVMEPNPLEDLSSPATPGAFRTAPPAPSPTRSSDTPAATPVNSVAPSRSTSVDNASMAACSGANCFLSPDLLCERRPKPLLAKLIEHQRNYPVFEPGVVLNTFGATIQTREYRAPEVILGMDFTASTDMWTFGCLAYELVTGDLLLSPRAYGHTSVDREIHAHQLSMMMQLIGPIPESITSMRVLYNGYYTRKHLGTHLPIRPSPTTCTPTTIPYAKDDEDAGAPSPMTMNATFPTVASSTSLCTPTARLTWEHPPVHLDLYYDRQGRFVLGNRLRPLRKLDKELQAYMPDSSGTPSAAPLAATSTSSPSPTPVPEAGLDTSTQSLEAKSDEMAGAQTGDSASDEAASIADFVLTCLGSFWPTQRPSASVMLGHAWLRHESTPGRVPLSSSRLSATCAPT